MSDLLGQAGQYHAVKVLWESGRASSCLRGATRGLLFCIVPLPALHLQLHFNREGCEELTSLLRLEEAPRLPFA